MSLQNTKNYTIRNLFEEDIQFSIPSYQRAYSWVVDDEKRKHVRQFIQDLADQHPEKDYYIGHLLFEEDEPTKLFVIDGQQRLTTIVIFFSCLVRELEERLAEGVSTLEIQTLSPARLAETYLRRSGKRRFTTVENDIAFFDERILDRSAAENGDTRSRRRIAQADAYISRELNQQETPTLLRWAQLVEDAVITTFKVSDKVQATQIFSFQNDRGKGLTDLEKLKAFLVYQVYLHSEPGQELETIKHIEGRFSDIYEKTEEIDFLNEDQILNHHCTAYLRTWGNAIDAVKKELTAIEVRTAKVAWIKNFSSALRETFTHVKALEGLSLGHEAIADPIILDAPNAWPILIKLYKCFGNDLLSHRFTRLLRLIEICLFKMYFLHGRCKNLLPDFAKAFSDNVESLQAKMELASKHSFMGGQDCNAALRARLSHPYHWSTEFRYLLWKYENYKRIRGDYELSPGVYMNELGDTRMGSTLDHITPRNPKDRSYEEAFNRECLNDLGNLVLMPHSMNARFNNKLPNEKRDLLIESSLASHREVGHTILKENQWDRKQIEDRKKLIVKFALKHWEAEPSNDEPIHESEQLPFDGSIEESGLSVQNSLPNDHFNLPESGLSIPSAL